MSLLAFENVSKSYGAQPQPLKMFLLTSQLEKLLVSLDQTAQGKQR